MNKNKSSILMTFFCLISFCVVGQNNAPLSKNAPKDQPINFISSEQTKDLDKKIAPYVEKAKKTLPEAKQKFLNGLNKGEAFFLTTRLFDKNENFEQVFIRVNKWDKETITGTIASDLNVVREYKSGQVIIFKEINILDWLITKPDGSEEGNFVGKYLDTLH